MRRRVEGLLPAGRRPASSSSGRVGCATSSSPSSCSSSSTAGMTPHLRSATTLEALGAPGQGRLCRPGRCRRAGRGVPLPADPGAPDPARQDAAHPPHAGQPDRSCGPGAFGRLRRRPGQRGPGGPAAPLPQRPAPPRTALLPPAALRRRAAGTDDSRLSPRAARAWLAALGFRDPAGAMRHLESLTLGVSGARRSNASSSPSCSAGSPTRPTGRRAARLPPGQ